MKIPIVTIFWLGVCYGSSDAHPPDCRADVGVDVRWVEAPDVDEREALSEWCATVGPPLLLDRRPPESNTTADSLLVVGWNTSVGGSDLLGFIEMLRQGVFTGGGEVRHFVLMLQEVVRVGDAVPEKHPHGRIPGRIFHHPPHGLRQDLVRCVEEMQLVAWYVPSMRNGEVREDRGNAILSTLPLHELTAIVLPLERQRRVAVAATVEGETTTARRWRLRTCSVHFDVRSRFSRFYRSFGGGRKRQAEALAAALPETPVVLGGDFNTWAPSFLESAIRHLRDHFPEPSDPDKKPTREIRVMRDRRLDHLFFRLEPLQEASYERIEDKFGSDHYPLLGWVRMSR